MLSKRAAKEVVGTGAATSGDSGAWKGGGASIGSVWFRFMAEAGGDEYYKKLPKYERTTFGPV
jgi:hypothetical protein